MGCNTSKNDLVFTVLSETELKDLMFITGYDRQTVLDWHQTFLFECPKGKLKKKNFIQIYKSFYEDLNKNIKPDQFCSLVFDAFDLNRNGWIDFNEFLAGLSFTNSSDVEKRLHIAFRVYDLDKNGYITKKEMEKVILAIYKMINLTDKSKDNNPKKRVEIMFQKMDLNKDGVLTENEFINGCMKDPVLIKAISYSLI